MVPKCRIDPENISGELRPTLKNQAKAHHRSLNKKVIATLPAATEKTPMIDVAQQLAEAREMRSKCKRMVTLDEIQAWRVEGRR